MEQIKTEPQALVNSVTVTLHISHPVWTNPVDSHNPFVTLSCPVPWVPFKKTLSRLSL